MQNYSTRRLLVFLPLASLLFAAAHVGFEYFNGGVQSHHLLDRSDLPAISNWLGLVTLPFLGAILALRVRNHTALSRWVGIPLAVLYASLGALVYGVILATSFTLDASSITNAAFFGLLPAALLLPLYRIEFIFGFVLGMIITFGSVLPLIIASVLAVLSFSVRWVARTLLRHVRRARKG